MNRIFKTVWSRTKNMYVVVSEIANSCGKSKGGHVIDRKAAFAAVLILTSSVPFGIQAALTPDQQVVYDAVMQKLAHTSGNAALGKVKVDNDKETLSLGYVQLDGKNGNLYLGTKAAGNEVGISQTQYTHGISGSNIAWGSGNVAGLALEAETKEATVDGKKTNIITGYKRTRQVDGFMIPLWNINSSGAGRSYSTAIGFLNAAYGVGAFSVGQYSVAGADSAFAGGHDAIASAKQAFAFGKEVKAMGENSVAMGEKSEAWAKNSFALGNMAKALDVGAVAMGNDATASGKSSFAVGVKSKATAYSTVALGDNAAAEGNYSVAMGHKAKATEENSSAVGTWAKATGQYSSALGTSSKAFGFLSTAVGGGKVSENGDNGLSMGYGAQTTVADGVSVGSNSVASRSENVYGYNVLGGNAYDTESIGAAYGQGKKEEIEGYNKSLAEKQPQLEAAEAAYNKAQQDLDDMFYGRPGALEFTSANRQKLEAEIERTKQVYENLQKDFDEIKVKRNKLTGAYLSSSAAVSVGDEETGMTRQITGVAAGTKDTDAVNVAQLKALNKKVDGKKDIHFFSSNGFDSDVNYDNQGARAGFTTAIGPDAMATEENSQAFGFRARAIGHSSIVFGVESTASGARDIAIGYGTHAVGSDNTNTSWNDTIAIGFDALSRGGSFASGSGAVAGGSGSVALGSGAYVGTKWLDDETQKAQNVTKWVLTRSFLDKGLRDELKAKFPKKFEEWERRAKNMPDAMGSEYLEQKLRTLAMEQLPQMTSPSMKNKMKDMGSSIAIGRGAKVYSAFAIAIGSEAKVGENLDDAIALGNQSLATRNAGGFGYDPTSDAKTWTDFKKAHPEVGVGAAREQEITTELNNIKVEMNKMGNEYAAWIDKEQHYDNYKEERKAYAESHGSTLDSNNEWVDWVIHARNEQQKLRKKGQELYDKFSELQKELNSGKGAWVGGKAALAIGNEEAGVTRQITGVAAGTKDTDAVNVAQLKVLNTKVDNLSANSGVHYFSVNSSETGEGSNYKNDGAVGKNSIAIGNKAEAFHWGSSAIGNQAWSIGAFSQAWGWGAIASGEKGIDKETYDKLSEAEKKNYQLYSFLLDTGDKSLYYRTKYEEYTPEEYRALPADRQQALDKIGYQYSEARKKEIMAPRSLAIGIYARAVGKYTTAVGNWANAAGIQATALGTQAKATGDFSIAAGDRAEASGGQSVAVGTQAKSDGAFSTAVGVRAKSSGQLSIAVGFKAVTNLTESIAMGNKAETVNGWSAAIGSGAKTQGTASTAVGGLKVSSTVDYGAAFGSYSVAQRASGVAGYLANGQAGLAWKSNLGAFSVGDDVKGYSRQITGVAAGSEDTDAVNVAQLKALNTKVDKVAANSGVHYFSVNSSETGEGSNYDNDGAQADDSMVIGIGSTSEGINSTVIGNNNKLTGNKTIKRAGKVVTVNNSIVAGQNLEVDGYSNTVFATEAIDDIDQRQTKVAGDHNTVIGAGNLVGYSEEDNRTYTKLDENISSNKNVVIGSQLTVSGSDNVVLGHLTKFELGEDEETKQVTTADSVTAIGIANHIGSEAQGGVAIGNELGINGQQTVAIGFGSEANAESAIAFGSYSFANAESAISIGNESHANAKNSVAIGGPLRTEGAPPTGTEGALATVENGVALGAGSVADREAGMAGYLSNGKTTAEWKSTLGALSIGAKFGEIEDTRQITGVAAGTKDTDAVNVAQLKAVESKITQAGAGAQKHTSVTAGKNISVTQKGTNAEGGKNYEVSLAKDIDLGTEGSIKAGDTTINNNSVTTNTVKAGDTTINNDGLTIKEGPVITKTKVDVNNQQIHHVKDGTADDDAATVGQVKEKIKEITTTVTGSSVTGGTIGEDGKISLTKGDKTTVELQGQLKDISARAGDYEIKDNKVTIGLEDNYSKKAAGNIVIKDVAKASDLKQETKERKDADKVITETIGAANKDELKTSYQDTTYIKNSTTLIEADKALDKAIGKNAGDIKKNTETINILGKQVGNLDTRVNRVGAGAAALAALHPLDFDPDDKWDFAAGYGNYMGANALALGAFYRPNETTQFSIGGSFGNGENMINAGVSLKVGKGSLPISSKVEMARQLTAQAQEIERLQQKDKERDMVIDNLQKCNNEQSEKITAMNDIVQQLQKEIERLKHK